MPKLKLLISINASLLLLCCVTLAIVIYFAVDKLDSTAIAAILGAVGGGLIGVFGTSFSSLIGFLDRTRDVEERRKDRVSAHAVELTKMDYQLRQEALGMTGKEQEFLAPIKVYREFYRAMIELHDQGSWPQKIEDLGLLRTFKLGTDKSANPGSNG